MPSIKFLGHLDVPPKGPLPLYTLAPVAADPKAIIAAAQQFGLSGDPAKGRLTQDAATLTYVEGSMQVTMHRASGGVRFHDLQRWQVDDGKADTKLADADAVALAQRYVKKMALAPLGEMRVLKVTRLRVGTADVTGAKAEERTIDVAVAFQRLIGGVPVDGPGGKLIVYLDASNQLSGVDRLWRGVKSASRPAALQPPAAAEKDLIKRWGSPDTSNNNSVEVSVPRFGYFEQGWNDAQTLLEPAYVFPLKLVSSDGRMKVGSVHVSAASVASKTLLTPPAKKVRKLRPRKIS